MVIRSIFDHSKLKQINNKWMKQEETKQKEEEKDLTPEMRQLRQYEEDMRRIREQRPKMEIDTKLKAGADLTLDEIEMITPEEKTIPGIPRVPHWLKFHEYQNNAINAWEDNRFIGIFDMATGTGKTFTGLGAVTRLFEKTGKLAVIIVCPYQHLVEQWVEDIVAFNMLPTIGYSASPQKDWKKRLDNDILDFSIGVIDCLCFVTTNATFSSDYVQTKLKGLGQNTVLVIDEAHNFGSERLRKTLNPRYQYRLALSATLERHGDKAGTQALYDYFEKKCIEYDLQRAIDEHKFTR